MEIPSMQHSWKVKIYGRRPRPQQSQICCLWLLLKGFDALSKDGGDFVSQMCLIAVDEAHLLNIWGASWRKIFMQIGWVWGQFSDVVMVAPTVTMHEGKHITSVCKFLRHVTHLSCCMASLSSLTSCCLMIYATNDVRHGQTDLISVNGVVIENINSKSRSGWPFFVCIQELIMSAGEYFIFPARNFCIVTACWWVCWTGLLWLSCWNT